MVILLLATIVLFYHLNAGSVVVGHDLDVDVSLDHLGDMRMPRAIKAALLRLREVKQFLPID